MWADDQVEQLKSMPNVPYATIKAAEGFPAFVKGQDKAKAQQFVTQHRADNTIKVKEWSGTVSDLHQRLEELEQAVSEGEASALDVLNEVGLIETQLNTAQRHYDALAHTEENLAAIMEDPSGYWETFVSKYPALRDKMRPNLAGYLAERGYGGRRVT